MNENDFEKLKLYTKYNFMIMDLCVCLMVFTSAWFADIFIRKRGSREFKLNNIIHVPDSVLSTEKNDPNDIARDDDTCQPKVKGKYLSFFIYNVIYFLIMFYSVLTMKKYPLFMVGIQHLAIILIINLYFLQFAKPTIAVPIALVYTVVWLLTVHTPYRWLVNNTIVIMSTLLTGYIQFRNFMYLQIFMWLAFIYDVYLLAGIQFMGYGGEIFSIEDVKPRITITKETCSNLLCTLFTHNHNYELPTVFSVQLWQQESHVFIGTGDIIIGAFVANFAFCFFKKMKHLFVMVLSFGISIALLSQVTETPFPALLSIVPLCTVGLLVSAIASRRSMELILDSTCATAKDAIEKTNKLTHNLV